MLQLSIKHLSLSNSLTKPISLMFRFERSTLYTLEGSSSPLASRIDLLSILFFKNYYQKLVTISKFPSKKMNQMPKQHFSLKKRTSDPQIVYNNLNKKMYQNAFYMFISLCLVASISSFRITVGNYSILEGNFNVTGFLHQEKEGTGPLIKRMTLFPYQVFQYEKKMNFFNYVLLKKSFQEVKEFLTGTIGTDNQSKKLLFSLLPQVIDIESDHNEYLDVDLLSGDIENRKIVIRNSTLESNNQIGNQIDLHFYSLQVHNYLFKVMSRAQTLAKRQQNQLLKKEEEEQNLLQDKNPLTTFNFTKSQNVSERDLIESIISQKLLTGNESLWKKDEYSNVLLQRIMMRKITKDTKYKAIFDGFSLHFVSVSVEEMKTQSTSDSTSNLEIVSVIRRAGEEKRSQMIIQPLSFPNFKSVQFLDMCATNGKVTIIISDRNKGYIIDITTLQWHLLRYIKNSNQGYEAIFFDQQCHVSGIDLVKVFTNQSVSLDSSEVIQEKIETRVTKLHPIEENKKWLFPAKLEKFIYFENRHFIMCFEGDSNCTLYIIPTIDELTMTESSFFIKLKDKRYTQTHLRTFLDELNLKTFLQLFDPSQNTQEMIPISSDLLFFNDTQKVLRSAFYDLQVYLNKTKFISYEMDRFVYLHSKNSLSKVSLTQQQLFDQLFNQQNENHCFDQSFTSLSEIRVEFNQSIPWSVCTIDIPTKTYLSLKFSFQNLMVRGYKLYICSSYFQKNSDPTFIDCSAIVDQVPNILTGQDIFYALRNNHFYKVYLIKQSPLSPSNFNTTDLPVLYIKDIERQQIQIASTIFFFIMLSLSMVLVTLIFFILLKNVIYNVLVYYGHVNERREPTFPLGWFALKTRLKRLQQAEILKFTRYEPSFSDTEGNHCCFCLQLLSNKAVVAEIYCGHEFHKECFTDWIKNEPNAKCPTCRRPFTLAGLADFQSGMGSNQELPQ